MRRGAHRRRCRPGGDEDLATHASGVVWCANIGTLLRRTDVDIVAICTPNGDHATQALAALAAGKHVVVEKPLVLTIEEALSTCECAGWRERYTGS